MFEKQGLMILFHIFIYLNFIFLTFFFNFNLDYLNSIYIKIQKMW